MGLRYIIYKNSVTSLSRVLTCSVSILSHVGPAQNCCHRSSQCSPRPGARRPSDLKTNTARMFLIMFSMISLPYRASGHVLDNLEIQVVFRILWWSKIYLGPKIRPVIQHCLVLQIPNPQPRSAAKPTRLRNAMPKPNHSFTGLRRSPQLSAAPRSQPIRAAPP